MATSYPPDWDTRRRRVYKRDGYTCQNCGRNVDSHGVELHAHHIVPVSKNGSHDISNLVTVCSDCHEAIHGKRMAPGAGEENDGSSWLSWATYHTPPQFGTCPNCGALNMDEVRITLRSSDDISHPLVDNGYRATCSGCTMELHCLGPSRWKLIDGMTKLEGKVLTRKQWDRIGAALRDEDNVEQVIENVLAEYKGRQRKYDLAATLFGLIAGLAVLMWVTTDSGIVWMALGLVSSIGGLIALKHKSW